MFADRDHPADPYPGTVPDRSFVHLDEVGHPLDPEPRAPSGWRVGPADLDDWLAARGGEPLAGRVPVLVYGSNRCPSKITWLRRELGLAGPVVVLRAQTRDVAAVWAAGLRARDGQRPATLSAAPGAREVHGLWLATPDQVAVLDRCEGRDERYRLARPDIAVRTEDGGVVERPWTYLGLAARRLPLLVDGAPVRCADLPQAATGTLVGEAAGDDGLGAGTVTGAPHADEWPAALFAYGLLRPGRSGWPPIGSHLAGEPTPARTAGPVNARPAGAEGTLIPLRDPVALWPGLDAHEGPGYRRVRVVLAGGGVAWAYLWVGDRAPGRRSAAPPGTPAWW